MNKKISGPKMLLKYLGVGGGILLLSLFAPQLPSRILTAYIREKRFQRSRFIQDLKRLQGRKLIEYRNEPDGSIKLTLTKTGKTFVLKYKFEDLKIPQPQRWDRKWRLAMFDIPHIQKRARDTLRDKLNELGFHQLQKSVFIYPYPCEQELDFIATILNVRQHILMITTNDFEGAEKLRHYFHLD